MSLNLARQVYIHCPLYYMSDNLLHYYHFLLSWVKMGQNGSKWVIVQTTRLTR